MYATYICIEFLAHKIEIAQIQVIYTKCINARIKICLAITLPC